ncbi:hypothetical protein EM868_09085 [Cupriavidus gilardii]|uniref:hypothetical protein n=1 Tax=Cupriavidus gilardii TaxID=82541 RepID=UPI001EE5DBFA|nr:hypothetical protein [Cupriavidus gilardii]MCG5259791.1 hypothetical protein [Cupriavidus gilardii]MDF9429950.1 hypothetical protein [Cupriavidus gilardii]
MKRIRKFTEAVFLVLMVALALLAFCVLLSFIWPGDEVAGWVQAVGSIAAIWGGLHGVAVGLRAERELRSADALDEKKATLLALHLAGMELLRTLGNVHYRLNHRQDTDVNAAVAWALDDLRAVLRRLPQEKLDETSLSRLFELRAVMAETYSLIGKATGRGSLPEMSDTFADLSQRVHALLRSSNETLRHLKITIPTSPRLGPEDLN